MFHIFSSLHFHIFVDHKIVACCSPRRGVWCYYEQRRELPLSVYHKSANKSALYTPFSNIFLKLSFINSAWHLLFAALRGYEDEIASEGRDHLKGNRIELSEEGKEVLNQKISQLRKGQEIIIKYFTDGYYENVAGVLDAVDVINKELRIYTGFINDTGKELPTIIAFEDILEIGVNMTWTTTFAIPAATASLLRNCRIDAPTAER